ncbi:Metalloenzyme, LuxS/M16 peptidase-like protein [Xylaria bambusicola]|uniref:Metalloenzyme, LuxS/M16 peptidase-like protein n=1 Tax=Xylaria bambusicola TaxID=326684 RepID=UPI0020088CE5|nr:Metalloenzyme, LuxS/M16 peptidase-like protein [Xylaria bambusicola]KAI0525554.1 Metalloenzyme, LuxS/M16 peptidase-like protein [Xylaria bambusicola]
MLRNAVKGAAKRAVTELSQYPKHGEKLHGFTLLRKKHVPELELTALHLKHDKTGADYLHIAREDSNNVFSIGFKTNPPDDTGVPHILEHTTLCGSEKYPIRDPFFKMLPRTLSNFMNAFTASDHTYYPFATTNAQDFRNLMSVYLDATLRPLLKETDFTQEGWRIGPENPRVAESDGQANAEDSRLVFKGVVYNEMKGQMSDADYLFYIRFQDHVFPAINNSGGDPQRITDLTYEQLKKFHAEHYHPSNAKLMTYGDMPLADHLREIDAQMSTFARIETDIDHKHPIDLSTGPRFVKVLGPVDPLVDSDKQYKTSISWIVGDTSDVVESFSLALLSSLLMDGYGSPLYKGLIENSRLGTDFSPNSGYDGSAATGIFSVGLAGVSEANVERVKNEIKQIIHKARKNGFERSKIEGYLHQLELSLKHKTANFGMSVLQRLKGRWFSGTDPFDLLAWNDTVAAFEARLAQGGYLEGLIDKYLINDNNLTFTMAPSEDYGTKLAKEEDERLAKRIAKATEEAGSEDAARRFFEQRELELLAEQDKSNTQDLSCLPSVHVKDIPREREPIIVRDEVLDNNAIQWREAPTNGLTYFRAIVTFENLPDPLRQLVPLFCDSLMRLGTKDMTMEQLEDRIKLKTGGVSVSYMTTPSATDFHQASEGLVLKGMALDRNVPEMFDILLKLVLETDFDSPKSARRVRQLLQASADGIVNDIASSGHVYARKYAESGLTRDAYLTEQLSGLSQVHLITHLAGLPESDSLVQLMWKLKMIQIAALNPKALNSKVRFALTCGPDSTAANSSALEQFASKQDEHSSGISFGPHEKHASTRDIKAFFPLPYQVYYGNLALPTVSYTSPDSAPLQILAQLLTHKHLHHEIREKGGAYGGGAYMKGLEGLFGFYSYRDPNPQNTISIMRNAGRWAFDKEWSNQDLEEAKISVFQSVDAPKSVSTEGMLRFVSGITDEMQQQRREQLLDVTKDQVREVAQKYIIDGLAKQSEQIAFLGKKQNWVDDSWKVKEIKVDVNK